MYTISKEFAFSAAHHLEGLPESHPCSRDHGHNYVVRVTLRSHTLNEVGFVVDYNELKALGRFLDETLDHRDLNEVLDFNPTAENLARYLYDWCRERWPEVTAVSVSETPKTWATYSPPGGVAL